MIHKNWSHVSICERMSLCPLMHCSTIVVHRAAPNYKNMFFPKAVPSGAVEVIWYSDRARDAIVFANYGDVALQSLEDLPGRILRALDGCIIGSPVSSFCLKYIADRTEKAVSVPRDTNHA